MSKSATEELRALLDARGVEWEGREDIHTDFTFWCGVHACETGPNPSLAVYHLTPEQAIAATLGSSNCTNSERTETCHADETEHVDISWQDGRRLTIHVMECDACGGTYEHVNGSYEYCPRCGAKVVDE